MAAPEGDHSRSARAVTRSATPRSIESPAEGAVGVVGRLVGGVVELDEQRGARLIRTIEPRSVHREVREEQHIAGVGRDRDSAVERPLVERQVPAATERLVPERSEAVAAGHHPDAPARLGRRVEVEDRGGDGVARWAR